MDPQVARDAERPAETVDAERRSRIWLLGLALVVMVALVYANAINHPFVYDDTETVVKNPSIRSLDRIPEMIGFQPDGGFAVKTRWTREVMHAVEYKMAGLWSPLYHATNVALHGIVAILTFVLIRRMTGSLWTGWWAAALFAVHPLNTEVVAHVSGRRGLLAALFALTALLMLQGHARRGGVWRVVAAGVSLFLAVFSKESAVMVPVAFVLVDLFDRARGDTVNVAGELVRRVRTRPVLYFASFALAGLLAVSILGFSADVGFEGSRGFYDTFGGGLTSFERLSLIGMGLRLLLLPIGQTVDYSYDALAVAGEGMRSWGWLDLALLAAAVGLTLHGIRRRSWTAFAGLWVAIFYLPHAGIIPWHEVFAERFLYVPAIGVCTAVAALGVWLADRFGAKPVAAAGLVVLVGLGSATVARNRVWAGPIPLWENAVERFPDCARAHKALGDAYLRESYPDEALAHYRKATMVMPRYLEAQVGVAVAQTSMRKYGPALETIDGVLAQWPTSSVALNAKAFIHQTLGDPGAAMDAYLLAVTHDPSFADGYNNLARLYVEQGEIDKAIEMYEKALEYNPAMLPALKNLATVYREGLEDEERAQYYEELADQLSATR